MCLGPPNRVSQYTCAISKIKDGGGGQLEKSKNHNITMMDKPS